MNDDAWDKVEVDFCAGASVRSLATKYGVSHVAIMKKRDKEEWEKGGKPKRKALRAKALKEKKEQKSLLQKSRRFLNEPQQRRNSVAAAQRSKWPKTLQKPV